MMKKVLVTDSLFIFPEHEQQLNDAGYEVERLDKLAATEEELAQAVRGKTGYILGGIEQVTEKVIDAADNLKAIVFTGIGYKGMIPAWQYATKKGIAIANVPDGPTQAVAEWSMAAALIMTRGFFDLARTGEEMTMTTTGLEDQRIGIIGLGRIGGRIVDMLPAFRPREVLYCSAHRHLDKEQAHELTYAKMDDLLQKSDIVFLCVSEDAGKDFFSRDQFAQMKQNALFVSFMHPGIVNSDALYEALRRGRLRAISDYPMDKRFDKFPLGTWYSFNTSNAINVRPMLQYTSDEAVTALINLLERGYDAHQVNKT